MLVHSQKLMDDFGIITISKPNLYMLHWVLPVTKWDGGALCMPLYITNPSSKGRL